MENSNCGCDCPFVKQGFCKTDKECPFYQESWWEQTNSEGTKQKLVKDCFPKRFGFQLNSQEHKFYALQCSVVELRNQILVLNDTVKQLIAMNIGAEKAEVVEDKIKLCHEEVKQIE